MNPTRHLVARIAGALVVGVGAVATGAGAGAGAGAAGAAARAAGVAACPAPAAAVAARVAAASDDNKVDLNTASEQELEQLPGMDEAGAKSIIANRPYASVGELKKADLSAREIVLITPLVTVRPPAKK